MLESLKNTSFALMRGLGLWSDRPQKGLQSPDGGHCSLEDDATVGQPPTENEIKTAPPAAAAPPAGGADALRQEPLSLLGKF